MPVKERQQSVLLSKQLLSIFRAAEIGRSLGIPLTSLEMCLSKDSVNQSVARNESLPKEQSRKQAEVENMNDFPTFVLSALHTSKHAFCQAR